MSAQIDRRSLEVAKVLLEAGCVHLNTQNPFSYASGLKGPIYCDNRLLLSVPVHRKSVMKNFHQLLMEASARHKVDALVGVATAGIPHAAYLSDLAHLPLMYVRAQKKGHGLGQQIEGWREGLVDVICIEDLVNQGGSLAKAVAAVQEHALRVQACLSIVDYQMPQAQVKLEQLGVRLFALTSFDALVECARQSGTITTSDVEALKRWQKDPENWS